MNLQNLDTLTAQFVAQLQQHGASFQYAGLRIFYYLALIQLVINCLRLVLINENLQAFVVVLIKTAINFSLFYGVILYAPIWLPQIVQGLVQLTTNNTAPATPARVISTAFILGQHIAAGFANTSILLHPFIAIDAVIIYLAIILIYALIAAELTIVTVQAYVIFTLSSFCLAFGVNDFTQPIMRNYCSTIVHLSLKLITMYLLISLQETMSENWTEYVQLAVQQQNMNDLIPIHMILVTLLIFFLLFKTIPHFIANLAGVGSLKSLMNFNQHKLNA